MANYWNYAIDYGRASVVRWLDATQEAAEKFRRAHAADKNWQADFYAELVTSGVGVFFGPLAGPIDQLSGPVKSVVEQAVSTLQTHVSNSLNQQLQLADRQAAAVTMYDSMIRGLNDARDHFLRHMNTILDPSRQRCDQLSRQAPGGTQRPADEDQVERWVEEILPCGRANSNQIMEQIQRMLESMWTEFARDQRTFSQLFWQDMQRFANLDEPPPSFVPKGDWDYTITFNPLKMRSGRLEQWGLKEARLAQWDGLFGSGSYKVNYSYTITFRFRRTQIPFQRTYEGNFHISANDTRAIVREYQLNVQRAVKERWQKLMSRNRPSRFQYTSVR